MSGDRGGGEAERPSLGLQDPRAVDILTAEHWSLLSHRALGYQEIFGRTTVFVATLTGAVVALALLAQATRFGRETLSVALLLIAVVLFIGLTTFVRSVAINYEDARWITGMNLLRHAYHATNAETVWDIIENNLPPLKSFVERHIRASGS